MPRLDRLALTSQRRANRRAWASLEATKDTFIADVKAEMCRRDPGHRHPRVIVTDGERALQRRVRSSFENVTLVLDLFHVLEVLEKLWPVAYVFHPEGSPEAEAFGKQRAHRILSGQVSQVVKGLRQMATKHHLRGEKAKTVRGVANYYYANRVHMAYDAYLAAGWPIGSGSVEGACKCLVRDRMERSGMRWTPGGAAAMLKPACCLPLGRPRGVLELARPAGPATAMTQGVLATRRRVATPRSFQACAIGGTICL